MQELLAPLLDTTAPLAAAHVVPSPPSALPPELVQEVPKCKGAID